MASKKSKILAMALCASVMTGIYAAPVMAAELPINVGSKLTGVDGPGVSNGEFTISGGTLNLDGADIAKALNDALPNGTELNLGNGRLTVGNIKTNGSVTANAGFTANGGSYYAIRGTNNQYTMLANEKYFALGSGGLLKGPEDSDNYNTTKERATFYVDNATGDVTTKGTLSGSGLTAEGASGGLYVRDVVGGKTMIYTKATDDGTNTVWIDPENGNISTIGTVGVTDDLESGKLITQIQGSGENIGDIAVGIQYDGGGNITGQNIVLDASTGDVIAKGTLSGTGLTAEGTYGGFHVEDVTNSETGESNTMIYTTDQDGHRTLSIDPNTGNLVTPGSLNVADGRFVVDKDTGNMAVNAADGNAVFQVNGNDGTVHVGKVGGAQTVITGNSITTETLNVENIKLGNSMTDKDGNTITIGAAGVIDIEKDGKTVFHADTDNFEAHYDNYDLTLDGTNGFALSNETSSFTLNGNGFAFAGPVNLGAASDVKFGYTGNLGGYTGGNYNLSQLVDTVNDIYNRTDGIYKDADGNTVISNEIGTWNEADKKTEYTGEGSKVTIGDDGATFENGESNGKTNINGSEIISDATNVESGSGSGSGFGGGTSTTNGDNAVYVGEDGDYTHVSSDGVTIGDQTNTNTTNVDKDGMVVDGEKGNTHISEGGMTVTDKTDNSTTNIDGNGMVVNGSNGTTHISEGGMTVTDKTDNSTTNIDGNGMVVNGSNGTTHISDSGMTVTGDNGTTNISGGDISVDNSVTVGSGENQTVVNNDGVTVGGEEGTSIKHDEISVGDGGYIGGGDVVSGEGVSLNQTAERVGHLENRVGELEDRIDKVGAMAAAIANLRTMGYDPAAPTEVAVGIGQYRDETGAALGLFHYPNRDFMLSLSVSTSGDEVMGGIGATWKFGRKSPEKVAEIKKAQAEADARRAEEAKLAKAEEMKQAAKEAKIKAQQERHAKLAAQRAAQAEAAK